MRLVVLSLLAGGGIVAWVRAHFVARLDRRALTLQLALDACVGALVLLAAVDDGLFESWMQEDAWAEWCTVFVFAAAATQQLARVIRPRPGARLVGVWSRLAVVAVAGFCVFVAGEEISWGQRLFGFAPPDIFLEENFQQELNVHNLLTNRELAGISLDSRFLVALVALAYGGGLLVLRRWSLGPLSAAIDAIAPPAALLPWFLGVAFVELSYPADLAGEACELVLGVLFLIAATAARFPAMLAADAPSALRDVGPWLLGPVALGIVAAPVVSRIVYGADTELVERTRAELELLRDDLLAEGVIRPKLLAKNRVHKRVFTAAREYLDLSRGLAYLDGEQSPATPGAQRPRKDRKGYFLDPWNNPYWIWVGKQSAHGLLYSFGPNRRRDTRVPKRRIGEDFQARGDDILVIVPLPASED